MEKIRKHRVFLKDGADVDIAIAVDSREFEAALFHSEVSDDEKSKFSFAIPLNIKFNYGYMSKYRQFHN